MMFTHYLLSRPLNFHECCIQQLILENPDDLTKVVLELKNQINGDSGSFCLCDGSKNLDVSKYVDLILSPLNIDLNNRQIIAGLYSKMSQSSNTNHLQRLSSLLSDVESFVTILSNEQPIEVDRMGVLDVVAIFKAMEIGFETRPTLSETISDYVSLIYEYTKIKLIVVVSMSQHMTSERIKELIHML